MPNVFISYVRDNSDQVDKLADELRRHGVSVWLDRDDILPGADWEYAIRQAIEGGDYFIACFSAEYAARRKTYMHTEIGLAIEMLQQMPIGLIWFIPVKLSECQVPNLPIGGGRTLTRLNWVPLYEDWDRGVRNILKAMEVEPKDLLKAVTLVIDNGEALLKPQRIIVCPYNAVIMQKGSYRTRILGPCVFENQDSETVKHILDLREKQAGGIVNAVETLDGALADTYVSVEYCIPVNEAAKQGRAPLTVSDMRAIEQVASYSGGMVQLAADEVARQVRKVFKAIPASYLDRPEAADHLGNRIQHRADEITRQHGLHILRVCLESVQVRPQETDQPEGTA